MGVKMKDLEEMDQFYQFTKIIIIHIRVKVKFIYIRGNM